MIRKLALPLIAAALLAGCNTMQGFGEDVGAAGQTIESEAAQTQQQM